MSILAIDPSVQPVIAYHLSDGTVDFWTEGRGAVHLPERLRSIFSTPPDRVYLEQPPYYFNGDAIQSSLRFAESAGVIKGILVTLGWSGKTILVPPMQWMNAIDPAVEHPTGRGAYNARKKYFERKAVEFFPRLPRGVLLSQGDALCLLHYGITNHEKRNHHSPAH